MEVNVAAIIQHKKYKDKFLLVRQAKESYQSGWWAFPAGRVEAGESLEAALKREVKEETSLDVYVIKLYDTIELPEENVIIHFYVCDYQEGQEGKVKPGSDVDEVRWVSLKEMRKYKMRPAMYKIIKKLCSSYT